MYIYIYIFLSSTLYIPTFVCNYHCAVRDTVFKVAFEALLIVGF